MDVIKAIYQAKINSNHVYTTDYYDTFSRKINL